MPKPSLIVTDIDNTLFDWVSYYVNSLEKMFDFLDQRFGLDRDLLAAEARDLFEKEDSIEYPFIVQSLPSVLELFAGDIERLLSEAVRPARDIFKKSALTYLVPYPGVTSTFDYLQKRWPELPLVALTDAPRYVAMWKLNKLGLLHRFAAIYGRSDPRLPVDLESAKIRVPPDLLMKHLRPNHFDFKGKIRVLPEEYEKPGPHGFKMILMDFDCEELEKRKHVLWIGDNLRKDVGLGKQLKVNTFWAAYGADVAPELMKRLSVFSPQKNIARHAALDPHSNESPKADFVLKKGFSDLLSYL